MKYKYILFLSALLFISCSTPYQKYTYNGGYFDKKIDKNLYEVGFEANSNTSMKRIYDFSLLRAAELTIKKRYKYFKIENSKKYYKSPANDRQNSSRKIHSIINTISLHNKKPAVKGYNAKKIYYNIRNKYGILPSYYYFY